MKYRGTLALMLLAAALAGCGERHANRNDTSVLGGNSHDEAGSAQLADAQGRAIPAPPAPPLSHATVVRSGDQQAVAAWVQDGHAVATTWSPPRGWAPAQPLEAIYGEASDVQVASNGQGQAMAVWHHRVGNIHSLRFSRFDGTRWSTPDVLPGALPQPDVAGAPAAANAPQLQMDARGDVVAQWTSGFHANEMQVARFTPGEGWSRPVNQPVASAPSASLPPRAPSSAP